ncbi:MAG: hypothetical protein QM755_14250 [Luteolibacter sp.]
MTEREAKTFAEETQGRECVAYVPAEEGKIHSPNGFERRLLWLSARLPRVAAMLALLLPAALGSCRNALMGAAVPLPQKQEKEVQRVVPGMPAAPTASAHKAKSDSMVLGETIPRREPLNPPEY